MNTFNRLAKTLAMGTLAVGCLALGACEKRAPTADPQGKGYVPSRDPSVAASSSPTSTGAPGDTAMPSPAEADKQLVAGRDNAMASDLYWVDGQGNRAMIHDTALLTQMQQRLSSDGFYRGATDGRTSPELMAAIRQLQAKKGIAETGSIDRQTADALGLDWAKLSGPTSDKSTVNKIGDKAREAGQAVENKAGEVGREIKQGASDLRRDVSGSDTARDVENGAKNVGRDIKTGAENAGDKIESGTKDVGREIEKGANDAKRKIDESVK